MKKHLQPLTPAALYARVSSNRQDVDLSVSAQLRALKDYAKANGYSVAREYVDEAESGRVADRPQFREMIEEGSQPKAPFQVILVWKFSRFTRKREHAVAFKSMLRRKGVRVVSITEHADDSPTGKLMEAIIESVDEFYSENFTSVLVAHGVRISMDSVGSYMDNVFVERLWRSVKYEEVYLKTYESVAEARAGIGAYLRFYNSERPHQTLDYRTPAQVFEEGRNQVHQPEVSLTSELAPA